MTARVIRATDADPHRRRGGCCEDDTVHLTSPDLPGWLADPFIKRGYRTPAGWCATCKSMFTMHNETINIYTHGIGAIFFLVVLILVGSASNLAGATTMALPSLAMPGDGSGTELLQSMFHNLKKGVESLELASMTALGSFAGTSSAGRAGGLAGQGAAACGTQWYAIHNGRHTLLALKAALLEHGSPQPSSRFTTTCVSEFAGVCTEAPSTSVVAAVQELVRGAQVRLQSAAAELERLGSAASAGAVHMGQAMERLRDETAVHLSGLSGQMRDLGHDGEGHWSAEEALRAFASAAERMEEELEERLDAALLLTARELGVERQRVRLTAESAAHGPSGAAGVRELAEAHRTAKWPTLVFLTSALVCLVCSVVFHLFWVVGERMSKFLARVDYAGIAVLIAGSTCPIIMYGFECDAAAVVATSCLMYGSCAVAVGMGLMDRFNTEAWRPGRALVFVAAGCAGIIPIGYLWWSQGHHAVVQQAVLQILVMGALYIVGAALYVTRVPERFFPGKLDLFGASHQLFHTLVFAAAFLHYHTVLLLFRWRSMQPECSAP